MEYHGIISHTDSTCPYIFSRKKMESALPYYGKGLPWFPSIGFKQTEMFGKVLVRFQVGFSDQQEYDKCCVCIENNLDLPIISRENSNDMSGEFSKNLTLFPDSQVIMSQSDFKQPPNRASQIAAQNPFQDSQVASSNLESQYHHRSQQKQQTQSQTQHPQAQSQTPTQAKPLTQSRPTHSVAYPDYSRLLLTPMSDNYPSSSYIQTSPIATNKRAPLNVHQRSHQSQQPLISDQDNSSGVNLRQILSELDNGSELYSMSDTELKNTIVEVLKQKSFVDIVKRIDTILEDS
ncbi:predicted protein [Scheffersomyces stipitis CBS 6054]|uniref:Uncharacterized protein n=1 Tax=Scheffersomyces stipitis (strain ATCC 58785 / CBS 6054 / NBRC 10063 / NRRL Y-11545) TaxID=322104 RepID=A3GHE4_PICST|nr:predicted protein [Scheffersomyces stipitis CBS 6054]EAZ62806.2 predicted protein [Scheffersomyces stipitis CBS 6054]